MSPAEAFTNLLAAAGARYVDWQGQRVVSDFGDVAGEYAAIVGNFAVADLSCRSRIELSGADRATFLHNLCTNEIRKLPVGQGCEAFLLNVQGKIVGHVLVLCRADSLLLETVPGAAPALMEHLERYHIREAVELTDRGDDLAELFVSGPPANETLAMLTNVTLPTAHLAGLEVEFAGIKGALWRVDLPPLVGFLLFVPRDELVQVWQTLQQAGAHPVGVTALEAARIEAGWPEYGRDINDRNLPQEVARDLRAINFTKGCYLGQETVARIDALGHVNKLLALVRFDGQQLPPPQTAITQAGQPAGETTSAVDSPRWKAPLALAYLRRGKHLPGTRLESPLGPCEVVPIEPSGS